MRHLAAVLAVCIAAGCQSQITAVPAPDPYRDMRSEIEQARTRAEQRPKNARVAFDYANALLSAHSEGYFEQSEDPFPLQHVVSVLDTAAAAQPGDAPALATTKAKIHLIVNQPNTAREILRGVVSEHVHVPAAILLVNSLGQDGEVEEVVAFCKTFNPLVPYGDEKIQLMTRCVLASGATSSETGLYWATEEDRAYYAAVKAEREDEMRQMEEERRQAEAERQQQAAEEEQYRRQQLAKREVCYSTCDEDNAYCRADCGYVERCYEECNRARGHCVDRCNRTVDVPLSPQQRQFREDLGW